MTAPTREELLALADEIEQDCDSGGVLLNESEAATVVAALRTAPPVFEGDQREILSALINTLADPCDASDFEDSESKALQATIRDALNICRELAIALRPSPVIGGAREALEALSMWVTTERLKYRVAGGMPAGGFDNMTPIEIALAKVESEIDRRALSLPPETKR